MLNERKPFPLGTRRKWKQGDVVKTRDGWVSAESPASKPSAPARVSNTRDWNLSGYDGQEREILNDMVKEQSAFEKTNPPGVRYDYAKDGTRISEKDGRHILTTFGKLGEIVTQQGSYNPVPSKPPAVKLATPKACFENAAKLVCAEPDRYDYAEGFVVADSMPFPIHHAYAIDKTNGNVVDPTLGWRPNAAYFGIRMKKKELIEELVRNKYYGVLLLPNGLPSEYLINKAGL